jgi:hypothetical protein
MRVVAVAAVVEAGYNIADIVYTTIVYIDKHMSI